MEETLSKEQINEVNARVKEIIETFREGLCNSAAFDLNSYWHLCMNNENEMSEACKYVYDTKKRIVEMIDKEIMLGCSFDESLYYEKRRKAKEKIIGDIENLVRPFYKGRAGGRDEYVLTQRSVVLAEFAIESGEALNTITNRGKNFPGLK